MSIYILALIFHSFYYKITVIFMIEIPRPGHRMWAEVTARINIGPIHLS